jgi:hypothetical protein
VLCRVFIIDVSSGDSVLRLGCVGGGDVGFLWSIYAAMHSHLLLKIVVLRHKYDFLDLYICLSFVLFVL